MAIYFLQLGMHFVSLTGTTFARINLNIYVSTVGTAVRTSTFEIYECRTKSPRTESPLLFFVDDE